MAKRVPFLRRTRFVCTETHWCEGLSSYEILRDLIEMEIANYMEFLPRIEMTPEGMDGFDGRVESGKELITAKGYEAIKDKNEAIAQDA